MPIEKYTAKKNSLKELLMLICIYFEYKISFETTTQQRKKNNQRYKEQKMVQLRCAGKICESRQLCSIRQKKISASSNIVDQSDRGRQK